jgi:hypothetical protein
VFLDISEMVTQKGGASTKGKAGMASSIRGTKKTAPMPKVSSGKVSSQKGGSSQAIPSKPGKSPTHLGKTKGDAVKGVPSKAPQRLEVPQRLEAPARLEQVRPNLALPKRKPTSKVWRF